MKLWRDDLQALDGRQHRDSRGDDPVAIEQAGAEDTQDQQHAAQGRAASFTACEASVSMATRPPSPLLSARSTSVTYLSETITVRVQNNIDSMP